MRCDDFHPSNRIWQSHRTRPDKATSLLRVDVEGRDCESGESFDATVLYKHARRDADTAFGADSPRLASFAVVHVREHQDLFFRRFPNSWAPPLDLSPAPNFGKVTELSRILRHIPVAGILIERDLEIYDEAQLAVESALATLSLIQDQGVGLKPPHVRASLPQFFGAPGAVSLTNE
jgi:hypothetical protein